MTDEPKKPQDARAIWCVLAAALVVRALVPILAAAVTADPKVFHSPDSVAYVALADELAATGQFQRYGAPEIIRTPGYPLLLLPGSLLGQTELVTICLQVLLGCFTVYLVYRIALLLFEKTGIALTCALLYALEPLSVLYTSKLLTETLFTCVVAVFVYCLVRYLKTGGHRPVNANRRLTPAAASSSSKGGTWMLLASAAALAASVYIRPISYFLPALVAAGLFVRALRRRPDRRRLLGHAALFLAASMALVGLWQVRNAVETRYTDFSAISDLNLYYYQGAAVLAAERGTSFAKVQQELGYNDDEVYLREHPELRDRPRAEMYRAMRTDGLRIIAQHPLTYAKVHLKGMARALLDPSAIEYLKLFHLYPQSGGLLGVAVDKGVWSAAAQLLRERPLAFWSTLAFGLVLAAYLLLAASALFLKAVRTNRALLAVALIAVYFLVICGGPQAEGRFRHPLMPVVCLLAGYSLFALVRMLRREAQPSPSPSEVTSQG